MKRSALWLSSLLKPLRSRPWPRSTAVADSLDPTRLIEEERFPHYEPEIFYPVFLGEILGNRYQVVTKLGIGTHSTVWLARDLYQWCWKSDKYVTVKVSTSNCHGEETAKEELRICELLAKADPQHTGSRFVRTVSDSFRQKGKEGQHLCLVFEPLREPLWLYQKRFEDGVVDLWMLKVLCDVMLNALDYTHRICHITNADLKLANILVRLENPSLLDKSARDEFSNPLPQKKLPDRTIYLPRNNYGPPEDLKGFGRMLPVITDFGHAVEGDGPYCGPIQGDPYRAPEVMLDSGWSYPADMWSFGVNLWNLLEGGDLFKGLYTRDDTQNGWDHHAHLAHMEALLGPPPKDMLANQSLFYSKDGVLKRKVEVPAGFSLENSITKIEGEEKREFLRFVGRILKWQPHERATAQELLQDPWIKNKGH